MTPPAVAHATTTADRPCTHPRPEWRLALGLHPTSRFATQHSCHVPTRVTAAGWRRPSSRWVKRWIDVVGASIGLLLLAPLLLVVAAVTLATSGWPIFFRQTRVGIDGRQFTMWKFRSMVRNAEAQRAKLDAYNEQSGPVFKMRRDPRVTTVGRYLRRYSLDELPQLANVLRGDMSLVGPRPPIPSEVAHYDQRQRRRLSVRPGLTCVWQISGRSTVGFEQWMEMDLAYIDGWSLALDMRILARTLGEVIRGGGS